MVQIALYQPDIPQNTGTILRMAACLEIPLHIIEPCGFAFSHTRLKRAGMDYLNFTKPTHHTAWKAFFQYCQEKHHRIILLTTKTKKNYTSVNFQPDDILLLGQESLGVPEHVHKTVAKRVTIPMAPKTRSLNVAISLAIVLGEAMRQTSSFPSIS